MKLHIFSKFKSSQNLAALQKYSQNPSWKKTKCPRGKKGLDTEIWQTVATAVT
jgi:hypothetical protein